MPVAMWPRTSSLRVWPNAARFRFPTPSAWPNRPRSASRPSAPDKVDDALIVKLVREHFDLRPWGIITMLDLLRPIYRQTASYGHFGREDIDLPWERTDKAAMLREGAGI